MNMFGAVNGQHDTKQWQGKYDNTFVLFFREGRGADGSHSKKCEQQNLAGTTYQKSSHLCLDLHQ